MSTPEICEDDLESSSTGGWPAVAASAAAIFTLVTAEMLPVGVLLQVSGDLGVSAGVAGLMVTAPGVVAAIAALAVPVAAGKLDRRPLLLGLMALLVAANAISALAPSFWTMLAARLAIGLSIGGFWAIASGLAPRLVTGRDVARASALIFGGVAAASVLGVPIGTTIGAWLGWRAAFWAVAALALVVLAALVVFLPRLPAPGAMRPSAFARLLALPAPRAGLIATFLIVVGHFAVYTFVSPLLERNGGIDPGAIGALLLTYGAAGVVANFAAGSLVARDVRKTVLGISAALGTVMLVTPLLGVGPVAATVLLIAWGLAYGGVSVSLQAFMREAAAEDAQEPANAAWAAVFNGSIALGAGLGGRIVDGLGLDQLMWFGGACVLLASLAVLSARR